MKRRSRILRVAKWAGVVVSALILTAFSVSLGRSILWTSPTNAYMLELRYGSLSVYWPSAIWYLDPNGYRTEPGWSLKSDRRPWTSIGRWIERSGDASYDWLRVPLWLLLVAIGFPTATLLYADRSHTYEAVGQWMKWLRPRRRSQLRRTIKLSLTGACIVLGIVFFVSLPWGFALQGQTQTVALSNGQLVWARTGKQDASMFKGNELAVTGVYWNTRWRPGWDVILERYGQPRRTQLVLVPLWLPLILAGIPAAFLSWYDRRHLVGHCPCGYDLTGNVSGTCPECGRKLPA